MAFTDEVAAMADEFWTAILAHPMVEALGEGTLDGAPFRYWVKQDYVYLIDYCRVFALGATKAPSLDHLGTFARLLESTVNTEMDLHRDYAAEFDLTAADLEATEPSPTTQGYTDFLVRTAALEPFGDLVAALLPCMWGFNETGRRLADRGRPSDERYAAWIDMYAGEEFTQLTDWCRSLLDEVAEDQPASVRARYRDRFRTSARYEYRFWDAAWTQEEWQV